VTPGWLAGAPARVPGAMPMRAIAEPASAIVRKAGIRLRVLIGDN
jgi:hypothetical protein